MKQEVIFLGNNQGSDNWQQFLTENAGRYVEIQAGIGKTQYGCIPMPPHSAWEWMEQYSAIQLIVILMSCLLKSYVMN